MARGYKQDCVCHPERKHYGHGLCMQCYRNTEVARAAQAEYRRTHKAEQKKKSADWYKENSEKVILVTHARRLVAAGWTQESYDVKFEEQHGLCAICDKEEVDRKLSADHEHVEPPNPRGLLCGPCNRAIGYLKDSPELLRKAADYIEKYQTQKTQN